MLANLSRPAGRALAVKDRNLADRARPAYRQSSGRVEASGQHVGDRMSGLAAQKPGRENGVGAVEQPGQRERAAGRKHGDDWLAEVEDGLRQRPLVSGEAEIGPARRFAAHRGGFAKTE